MLSNPVHSLDSVAVNTHKQSFHQIDYYAKIGGSTSTGVCMQWRGKTLAPGTYPLGLEYGHPLKPFSPNDIVQNSAVFMSNSMSPL